jgi:hypothetical protein
VSNSRGLGSRSGRSQGRPSAFEASALSAASSQDSASQDAAKRPPAAAMLEPKKGPEKEPLNTRVLASTSRRLGWFTNEYGYSVTNVVDVALQEFFARNGVPDIDSNGEVVD